MVGAGKDTASQEKTAVPPTTKGAVDTGCLVMVMWEAVAIRVIFMYSIKPNHSLKVCHHDIIYSTCMYVLGNTIH